MQVSFFLGMVLFAFLEVVRNRFSASYGLEAKESMEYVLVVSCLLFIMFFAFPGDQ
jgi:hypothetical protein